MGLNVLIVDDSSTMRSMVMKTIKMSGVPVSQFFQAANGKDGLDIIGSQWIDVVFVDINMPVMGGLEMIDKLRQNPAHAQLPTIVISTESSLTRIQEVHAKGVHFIHKPFTPERLREVVSDLLGDLPFRVQASETQLEKVAKNVLETMAFSFIMPGEDGQSKTGEEDLKSVLVRFHGPFNGIVILTMTSRSILEIVENMLGQDDEIEIAEQQQNDALGELANVMCGNLLAELAGPEPVFNLESPEMLLGKPELLASDLPGDITRSRLFFEDGWAELTLAVTDCGNPSKIVSIIEGIS